MADMVELVIKIPEDEYKNILLTGKASFCAVNAIEAGMPLPKGHGKLVDVKDAVDNLMEYKEIGIFGNHDKRTILGCIDRIENHVEPIIEADKEDLDQKEERV